jgi:dolichol-phosphate mannosyltransferase
MDCDLQDQPEEIAKLYSKASGEGFEIVFGRRIQRRDTAFKTFLSRSFHLTFWYLADVKLDPTVANFSIATHQVMEVYRGLRESGRSHFLTLLWCGFRVGYADVDHAERFAGKTTYTLRRSLDLAFDSITARSNKPLRLSIMAGFLMSALSLLLAANIVVRKLVWGIPVSGWASTMVSIYFTGGLLMANLGVIGLYLGKVFDQARNRPIYVVRECVNFTNPALGTSGGASTSR